MQSFQFRFDLVSGQGRAIVNAWKALAGEDSALMRAQAAGVRKLALEKFPAGRLRGLLFGDPARFLNDLVMQLEMKAAYEDLLRASRDGGNLKFALANFVSAAEVWQKQHGYQNGWDWPGMHTALEKLNSPQINELFSVRLRPMASPEGGLELTGGGNLAQSLSDAETFTTRLLAAMKKAVAAMP